MASGGSGTTTAGLTCAAVRESSGSEFTLEAGALVLADRGVCAIDEFSCINKDDRTSIHEALEQQTISVAKAGIICKLNCRATVVAVSNPKGGIFDPDRSFIDNCGISSPLLSRFDLIFKLIDSSDAVKDENVATFLLNRAIVGSGFDCSKKSSDTSKEFWSMDKLRAYIATVKSRFHPIVSDEAARLLQLHYETCRKLGDVISVPVTVRFFESLIRLSQAHARLMFRDTVTLDDAVAIILLMECSVYSTSESNFRSNQHFFFKDPMSTTFPDDEYADSNFMQDKMQLLTQYSIKENDDNICREECSTLHRPGSMSVYDSHSVTDDDWKNYRSNRNHL
jgi:DNA helicase MCM9